MIYRVASSLLLLLSLLPALGCDKATPVAPNGTVLTISANPSQVGLNGRSTITVVGRRPDGNPLNPGTEIRLSTDKGSIDSIVTTDDGGRATATFRADGRLGIAKITAMTGGNIMVTTDVQVGQAEGDRPTVLVSVTPSNLALGSDAMVTVIARNSDGTPAAGQQVLLTTTLGTLTNDRPRTGNDGRATTTLQSGNREGMATITAVVGSSMPATTMVTIFRDAATTISVQVQPASIQATTGGMITISAFVSNIQGQGVPDAPVTFQSEIGTLENNEVVPTGSTGGTLGQATKKLTVTPQDIPPSITSFEVRATTPSSTGTTLVGTINVRIIRQQ